MSASAASASEVEELRSWKEEGGRKRETQRHTDRKTQAGKKFSSSSLSLFLI